MQSFISFCWVFQIFTRFLYSKLYTILIDIIIKKEPLYSIASTQLMKFFTFKLIHFSKQSNIKKPIRSVHTEWNFSKFNLLRTRRKNIIQDSMQLTYENFDKQFNLEITWNGLYCLRYCLKFTWNGLYCTIYSYAFIIINTLLLPLFFSKCLRRIPLNLPKLVFIFKQWQGISRKQWHTINFLNNFFC